MAGEGDDSDGDDSEDDGEGTEGFAEAEYTVVLWSVDDLSNPTFREAAAMIAAGSQLRQELWEEESGFERYERAMELRKAMAEQILNGHQNLRPDLREAMAERRSLRHQTGKWFAEWRWWRRCREPDQKDEAKQNAERARAQRAKAAKEAAAKAAAEARLAAEMKAHEEALTATKIATEMAAGDSGQESVELRREREERQQAQEELRTSGSRRHPRWCTQIRPSLCLLRTSLSPTRSLGAALTARPCTCKRQTTVHLSPGHRSCACGYPTRRSSHSRTPSSPGTRQGGGCLGVWR